jgi:hypothetical protein
LKRGESTRKLPQPFEEHLAGAITRFTGSMVFVYLHLALFGLWIVSNPKWKNSSKMSHREQSSTKERRSAPATPDRADAALASRQHLIEVNPSVAHINETHRAALGGFDKAKAG